MANGIRALAAAGCDVIVDDIAFNFEPYYQDGQINQAVLDVVAAGVVYAGSAGNYADKHYQARFSPGTYSAVAGTWHRWLTDDETFTMQIGPYGSLVVSLQWNDAWGASANDYDLYLFNDSLSDVLKYSTDRQTGSGLPVEGFASTTPSAPPFG